MTKFLKSKWVWLAGGIVLALAFSDKLLPEWEKLMAKVKGGAGSTGGVKI